MKPQRLVPHLILGAVAAMLMAPVAGAEDTSTLKITFKFKGDAPKAELIDPDKDKAFCGKHEIPDESLVVNPKNNGIRDVIVFVYTGRRGTDLKDLPATKSEPKTHTLANLNCRFEPHVLIAQQGDTIKVTNPDTVGHNANFAFFNNKAQNLTVPAGGSVEVELKETEPSAIPVDCNIHPWMKSRLLVVDHPFAAASDENGVLEIKGLPAGKEIVFRAFHETGSFKDILLNGKKDGWRSNKFELELKSGMNDLGVVEVDAEAFEND